MAAPEHPSVVRATREAGTIRLVVGATAELAADALTIDALARLHLAAKRAGARLVVDGASRDLRALVDLVGLADVLELRPASGRRAEAEQWEQPLGVEERVERRDPAV